ncbi:phosphomannomutase/phosphoglucomutase [Alloalcanivorax mobilis]|uniref:phosphomannomutase/phosphoglucomutase n=1 Tax=Alloalcanivorax mobilis TaxID=2019569 RepID=UPI000C765C67|nr:phosphomannomutase/phosphoglucomutase [Alloalcanivorax mobilis]
MGKTNSKRPARAGHGGSAFRGAALVLAALTLLAVAAGLAVLQWQHQQQARDTASADATRLANSLANELATQTRRDRQQLAGLDEATLAPAATGGPGIVAGPWLADSRLTRIPEGAEDNPALSFTERDLLRQQRQSGEDATSARGGEHPAVLLAHGVPGATLMLERDLKPMLQSLPARLPPGAGLTLSQDALTLARHGTPASGSPQASARGGPFTVTVSVPPAPTHWLTLLPAAALMAGLMVAAGGVVLAWLARRLRGDAARLANEAGQRAPAQAAPLAFPALEAVRQARTSAPSPPAAPTAAPAPAKAPSAPDKPASGPALPEELFRAYDIRGITDDPLSAEAVKLLGQAIGSEAGEAGQQIVYVARDGRLSGPALMEALIGGLAASGRDVVDLGMVPSPVLYYATEVLESQSGVCLTGSHNPPEYNGLKIVIAGQTLHGERLKALRQRIIDRRLDQGQGSVATRELDQRYLRAISDDIVLARPMSVAVDCGNGATGLIAPALFEELGCKVVPLFTDVDGRFPHHQPDPSQPDNLSALVEAVKSGRLDLGVAFDGDGDRLGVVACDGEIIWADRLMMLFARDLLSRNPGADVLFDVKCSRALPSLVRKLGGRPVMYKTGRPLIRERMKELAAPLAGEMSGHIFFADRWFGFDDALYAAARLLEILSLSQNDSAGVFAGLRTGVTTPELAINVGEARKFELMQALCERAERFPGGRPNTVDGLRVDFPDGWGLIRASNTTPALVTRFEGRDQQALERIQLMFREQIGAVDSELNLPF